MPQGTKISRALSVFHSEAMAIPEAKQQAEPKTHPLTVRSVTVLMPLVETAQAWFQRSCRKRALAGIPKDSSSAAWAFFRSGGTGIAFLDTLLRRQGGSDQLPIIDIRGDFGKTWTVVSLAARFVVATRPSQFPTAVGDHSSLPQVIVMDTTHDVTTSKVALSVRSTLLRQFGSAVEDSFEMDMISCLGRIHVATADDAFGWVPILETLRYKLAPLSAEGPTLILWDGFLSDAEHDEANRMEIIRQLGRLVEDCSVVLVTASTGYRHKHEWNKYVTHHIRLDRNESNGTGHEFLATIHGSQIPFSLSAAGILS